MTENEYEEVKKNIEKIRKHLPEICKKIAQDHSPFPGELSRKFFEKSNFVPGHINAIALGKYNNMLLETIIRNLDIYYSVGGE